MRAGDRADRLLHYCEAAQVRGMTLRMALACYRAAGGRIRTQTFCRLWRLAREAREQDAWDRL